MTKSTREYCSFYVDDLLCGVETQNVLEIVGGKKVTTVPKAPLTVAGLVNLRGQIIVAMNMSHYLRPNKNSQVEATINIVLNTKEGPLSLLVHQIGEVIIVDEEGFSPSAQANDSTERLVAGVYKLDEKLLHVLDPAALFEGLDA